MITPQQRRALLFIEAQIARSGIAPTVKELAQHLGHRSTGHAGRLISGLEERGYIRKLPGRWRAMEVTKPITRYKALRFDPKAKRLLPLIPQNPKT